MFRSSKPSENQQSKAMLSLIRRSIKLFQKFNPQHEYRDRVWKFYLKVGSKWHLFGAREDRELFIIFSSKFETLIYNSEEGKLVEADPYADYKNLLPPFLTALEKLASSLKKDPIRTNYEIIKGISPTLREGVIHRGHVRTLLPDWNRYDKELGAKNVQAMIELIENYGLQDTKIPKMTASLYFDYCKVAYLANSDIKEDFSVDPSMSGREMYKRWADGRDGGLKEIDQKSEDAFREWLKGRMGDHPWEIYRGGNTTHIDLSAEEYAGSWRISLTAYSSGRLAETCRIALALKDAGLPFHLRHEKSYLKRLLCDDFVGVIPEHDSPHRGWQRFPEEFCVADVIQFSWFRDENTRKWIKPPKQIASLIYWMPEEPSTLK